MEATQMSTDVQINKIWYIFTMEFYPTLKKKGILSHAITWMNVEDILPS